MIVALKKYLTVFEIYWLSKVFEIIRIFNRRTKTKLLTENFK